MTAISIGLSNASLMQLDLSTRLIMSGLTGEIARVGDVLTASLSNQMPISSFAWGSTARGTEYGITPNLVVPTGAADSVLHITVTTQNLSLIHI